MSYQLIVTHDTLPTAMDCHTRRIMKKQAYTFKEGVLDGIPIGMGYLSVSFGLGIAAVAAGLSPLIALIISMTNETSAGQKAGLDLIAECLPLAEGILTMILSHIEEISTALPSTSFQKNMSPLSSQSS